VLGTLLVSILVARTQLERQDRRAQDRLAACAILDDLLAQWRDDPAAAPSGGQGAGDVASANGWRWRSSIIPREDAAALNADVMAVAVFAPGQTAEPAGRIEVLRPREIPDETDPTTQPSPDAG
jgi:hypothetical protein